MIYLDYAATTPVLPQVAEAMYTALKEDFGNPSSQYRIGREAKAKLDANRETIAKALGCSAGELYFTSCGTESDNWAIRSGAYAARHTGKHIITGSTEHSAVLELLHQMEGEGYCVTYLKPDKMGNITVAQVEDALREDTCLVTLMSVNNELGNICPIADIAKMLKAKNSKALLHTDAVQAFLKIPMDAKTLGADLISISGHKIGAPKGIGALYIKSGLKLRPLLPGGGQEGGLRSGTEATAQIAGLAKAVELRYSNLDAILAHTAHMQRYAIEKLSAIDTLKILGNPQAPHILSLTLPGYPAQNIVNELDAKDIFISAGSACHRGKPSNVIAALGLSKAESSGAIRISFGPDTETAHIDALYDALLAHKQSRYPMF